MSVRSIGPSVIILSAVVVLALSGALPVLAGQPAIAGPGIGAIGTASTANVLGNVPSRTAAPPAAPALGFAGATSPTTQFDERVLKTAAELGAAGVLRSNVRLPYIGTPARVVDGAVVPGYAVAAALGPAYSSAPAPAGIAYYGESDTGGGVQATVLNASSLAGSIAVNHLRALYMDTGTPDDWGIQENAVLGNVTLAGGHGYEFWTQNAVDVYQHNQTIALGQDTWNFSSPGAGLEPNSVLRHNPNGSFTAGLYIGEGPFIYAPAPFTLTLYLNSSVTSDGNQELWYNYSLSAAGGIHRAGNYDWLVFNSGGSVSPGSIAPFVADGTQLDPIGAPNDFELDYGIGAFNGATNDVLDAKATATLSYCPATQAACSPSQYQSVPAALDFGSETGETSSGLAFAYSGTTETATAGPFVLRGLWGYGGSVGAASGSTPVANHITVSGSPLALHAQPYVFVFLSTPSAYDYSLYEWAPDVPVWHLSPGTYSYAILLADYAEQSGVFTVGSTPTALSVTLPYHPASGVYTPLWAFSNGQLAGISSSGSGKVDQQFVLFNNPTASCTECGGAPDQNLSSFFFAYNDFSYPVFAGILLDGTTAFTEVLNPPSFCTFWFAWGPVGPDMANVCFDLQLEFVSVHRLTINGANLDGGWPVMFEVETVVGGVDPTQNFFPQANVMFWNSSHDLVMSSTFVPTINPPYFGSIPPGVPPEWVCNTCVSPDGLLFYGGSHNVVWGNTFHDPTVPALGDAFTGWAGLVEAESGDLIYNNNFSIDNPVVYLPFDIYEAACPDGYAGQCGNLVPPAYHDRWNVPLQPASSVSSIVNGFSLSGNILGPSYPLQGGNYWSNYGGFLNPIGKLPYVNTFDYSDYANAGYLPPGTPTVHQSILVGGDFYPLLRAPVGEYPVLFLRVGTPYHAFWQASIGNGLWYASSWPALLLYASPGVQSFTVVSPAGYVLLAIYGPNSPTLTTIDVTGPSSFLLVFGT